MKVFKKYLSVCAACGLLIGGISSCAPVKFSEGPFNTKWNDDELRLGIIQLRSALKIIEDHPEQIKEIRFDKVPRVCKFSECSGRIDLHKAATKIMAKFGIDQPFFWNFNDSSFANIVGGDKEADLEAAMLLDRVKSLSRNQQSTAQKDNFKNDLFEELSFKTYNVKDDTQLKYSLRNQKISLQVENTQPTEIGDFVISVKANTDTASLKINGEEQGGRSDGKYSIKKFARAGVDTQFTIVATDTNGNTDTKTITVNRRITESKSLVAALNPTQVKQQPSKDAVAIIIGIADYKNLPRADYANDDARVFYDYAIRALGVKPENIKLLVDTDADDVAIYQAFKTWLPSRVRAGTDVYVYYSGHGLPTADGQGLYLLPQRAHRDFIDKTAITQAEINAAIQAAKPRSVTVFLDSCYSGQARSGETLIASARPVALKTEKQLFPENFTVITASQADQISSSSPDLKHGIFSYYLMRGMEGDADVNRDGRITAGEMQAYLAENVSRQAGMQNRVQQPQLIGDVNRVLVGR